MLTNLGKFGLKKVAEPTNPGASSSPGRNSIFGQVVLTYEAPPHLHKSICALSLVKEVEKDHAVLVLEKLQRPTPPPPSLSTAVTPATSTSTPEPQHVIHVGELILVTDDGQPAPTLEAISSSSSGEGRVDFTQRSPQSFLDHYGDRKLTGISYQVSLAGYNAVFERMGQDADGTNPNRRIFTYWASGYSQASSVSRSVTENQFHNCISYLIHDVLPLAQVKVSEDTWYASHWCPIKYPDYIFEAIGSKYSKGSNSNVN